MVRFLNTMVVCIVVFFVLTLAQAIFSPIMNSTLGPLVDDSIYYGQSHSGANGDQTSYYANLYSAKALVLSFYNLFPFIMSCLLCFYMIGSSLKKEQSDYPM